MDKLNINTGKRKYFLNDTDEYISFNPSDPEFAQKIVDAFRKCHKITESAKLAFNGSADSIFEELRKIDMEIKRTIDAAFGEPVCDKAFDGASAIGLSDGLPVWVNFMMAIIDEIDSSVADAKNKISPSTQRYLEKFQKKYGNMK